jgi:hypothetical protein
VPILSESSLELLRSLGAAEIGAGILMSSIAVGLVIWIVEMRSHRLHR